MISMTALLLSGCVVGPDYVKPGLFGSSSHTSQSARPLPEVSQWWKRFKDPVLDRIIDKAVSQNLTVASAKAKVREARASYRVAGGQDLPSLAASGTGRRGGLIESSSSSSFDAGIDARWEVDLFGANARSKEAARAGLDASTEELRAATATLIADVATNYVNARGYQERLSLSRKTISSQKKTRDLVQTKQSLGAASDLDVANADGQVSSTETGVPDLEIALQQAVHRLGVLTGDEPTALKGVLTERRAIPQVSTNLSTIAADAISARPDIRVAERQLARATANIGIAEAAKYPSVSLTGSISSSAVTIGDLAKSSTISWALGPSLNVPIFNNGRLEANVDVARAQRDQSFLNYQASVLEALEDVENALVSTRQNKNKQTKIRASIGSYRQVYDLTRASYDNGASDFLDVLTAERSLFSAQTNAIQNKVAMALDYISLNRALGAGWDGYLDISKPTVIDLQTGPKLRFK